MALAGIKEFIEAGGALAPKRKRGEHGAEEGMRAQLLQDKRFVKVTATILSGAVGKSAVELYDDFEGLRALKVSNGSLGARTWGGARREIMSRATNWNGTLPSKLGVAGRSLAERQVKARVKTCEVLQMECLTFTSHTRMRKGLAYARV